MHSLPTLPPMHVMSAPTRGPWIEIKELKENKEALSESAPTRGPWIEIAQRGNPVQVPVVGPHTGAVD